LFHSAYTIHHCYSPCAILGSYRSGDHYRFVTPPAVWSSLRTYRLDTVYFTTTGFHLARSTACVTRVGPPGCLLTAITCDTASPIRVPPTAWALPGAYSPDLHYTTGVPFHFRGTTVAPRYRDFVTRTPMERLPAPHFEPIRLPPAAVTPFHTFCHPHHLRNVCVDRTVTRPTLLGVLHRTCRCYRSPPASLPLFTAITIAVPDHILCLTATPFSDLPHLLGYLPRCVRPTIGLPFDTLLPIPTFIHHSTTHLHYKLPFHSLRPCH